MPLLSFSGETSQGPFWKQVLLEWKTQTCRRPRKRPIKKGDKLFIYWKCRQKISTKPIHFIGEGICTKTDRYYYSDFADDDAFAMRDGFRDAKEMQSWFGDPYFDDAIYDVIQFRLTKPNPNLPEAIQKELEETRKKKRIKVKGHYRLITRGKQGTFQTVEKWSSQK